MCWNICILELLWSYWGCIKWIEMFEYMILLLMRQCCLSSFWGRKQPAPRGAAVWFWTAVKGLFWWHLQGCSSHNRSPCRSPCMNKVAVKRPEILNAEFTPLISRSKQTLIWNWRGKKVGLPLPKKLFLFVDFFSKVRWKTNQLHSNTLLFFLLKIQLLDFSGGRS